MYAVMSVGMSTQGIRPVAEAPVCGVTARMLDHTMHRAARLRTRTRGRMSSPMVLRFPTGGGIHAPEHHAESPEALFAHTPGLRVVMPSSPSRAYGLLLAAIRDPDPVVFMEPKRIYRWVKEEVEDNGEELPMDVCYTLRDGDDITLVSWGAMIKETLQAADQLEAQGLGVEVIDVATISPLDMDTIIESVERTGRCVIIQEAPRHCSVASEIAAGLADAGSWHLQAPVKTVCGYDVIMPLYRSEERRGGKEWRERRAG